MDVAEKAKRSAIGEAINPKAYPVPDDNDLQRRQHGKIVFCEQEALHKNTAGIADVSTGAYRRRNSHGSEDEAGYSALELRVSLDHDQTQQPDARDQKKE